MDNPRIIWTIQARDSLHRIYKHYKKKSLRGAENVKNDLLRAPKTIYFSKQYQLDDINPKYRRIVVRDFKILYKESKNIIEVIDIIGTKQSPSVLKRL